MATEHKWLEDLSDGAIKAFIAKMEWGTSIQSCCGIHLWRNIDNHSFVFTNWRDCALDLLVECGVTYEEVSRELCIIC